MNAANQAPRSQPLTPGALVGDSTRAIASSASSASFCAAKSIRGSLTSRRTPSLVLTTQYQSLINTVVSSARMKITSQRIQDRTSSAARNWRTHHHATIRQSSGYTQVMRSILRYLARNASSARVRNPAARDGDAGLLQNIPRGGFRARQSQCVPPERFLPAHKQRLQGGGIALATAKDGQFVLDGLAHAHFESDSVSTCKVKRWIPHEVWKLRQAASSLAARAVSAASAIAQSLSNTSCCEPDHPNRSPTDSW